MNLLYESETFAVMHLLANAPAETAPATSKPMLERHGFEIVDKRSGKEAVSYTHLTLPTICSV